MELHTIGLGAEYLARVALIYHLLDLGPQPWNPPFTSYVCHCVCNSQVHYLFMRMSDELFAKHASLDVYRIVTWYPSFTPQDACVVLD